MKNVARRTIFDLLRTTLARRLDPPRRRLYYLRHLQLEQHVGQQPHRNVPLVLIEDVHFAHDQCSTHLDEPRSGGESTETGRDEVYVRPFPNSDDGKWQVSTVGGLNPKWSRSGDELFYVSGGEMTAARVSTDGGVFRILDRLPLFNVV